MTEAVTLLTTDGVRIAGQFVAAGTTDGGAVLLLHMMPATKESWADFAVALAARGVNSLAIDLRGHGASTVAADGTRLDYKLFEDADHQAKRLDVEAALVWLQARNFSLHNIVVIGASIGANLAIVAAAEHPEIPGAAALSPGLDYRGVTTPDKVRAMRPQQELFLAASAEDELSFHTNRELATLKKNATLKEFRDSGHGTAMFEHQPDFIGELVTWTKTLVTKS